jgi:hypothetical protein
MKYRNFILEFAVAVGDEITAMRSDVIGYGLDMI